MFVCVCACVCACARKWYRHQKDFFLNLNNSSKYQRTAWCQKRETPMENRRRIKKKKNCMKLRGYEMFHEEITFMMVLKEKAEQLRERALEGFPGHTDTKVRD